MKVPPIITILLLFSFHTAFSQLKQVKKNTGSRHRGTQYKNKLGLKDFRHATDELNFRFRNQGQIIEISKDSTGLIGSVTNYIYHTKKVNSSQSEIFSDKIILSSKQAKDVYNIVQNYEVRNLPSDKDIKNWKFGTDGITYTFEYADKSNYWLKNYWTPSAQDSIPEALKVLKLIDDLSDTLNLQETYSLFKKDLPKKGCYKSRGGIANMCYVPNSLELGYSGAVKLPLGVYVYYGASYFGKIKINGSGALQYNFDNHGFYHLNLQTAKWNIFYRKSNISDFVAYNYQNRKLNTGKTKNKFETHQIKYGLNLRKNISVGMGLDYLIADTKKIGWHFYGYNWFSKPDISTVLTSSIFGGQINYKAEVIKSFHINGKLPVRRVSSGLAYENFMAYEDLYFKVQILF